MSKPHDISQQAWDAATEIFDRIDPEATQSIKPITLIARAVMAATLAEREACLRLASAAPIGNLHQTNETDLKRLWKLAGSAQAGAIADAIAKRSEA